MTRDRTPIRGITVMVAIAVVSLAVVASAGSAAVAAQQAPATAFITINPEAGFPLDPFIISLQAGGPVNASTVAKECKGFVTKNPTVSVDYKGKADMLKMFFYSDGDPVLIVRTADGKVLHQPGAAGPHGDADEAGSGKVRHLGRQRAGPRPDPGLPGLHGARRRRRRQAGLAGAGQAACRG